MREGTSKKTAAPDIRATVWGVARKPKKTGKGSRKRAGTSLKVNCCDNGGGGQKLCERKIPVQRRVNQNRERNKKPRIKKSILNDKSERSIPKSEFVSGFNMNWPPGPRELRVNRSAGVVAT